MPWMLRSFPSPAVQQAPSRGAEAAAPPPESRLAGLLRPERIVLGAPVHDVDALFAQVAARLPLRARGAAAMVSERLARRHRRRSTALGGGVALPHAEVTHLPSPLAVFVRPSTPLAMGAPDGLPVRVVVALLVPKPATSSEHALLADLSAWLQQPGLCSALDAARTVSSVWQLLAHWPWV